MVLESKKVGTTIELMFACFRNYANCDHDGQKSGNGLLLQKSQWHSDPNELQTFMDTCNATGGTHWEEAVEVGLQFANREAERISSETPLAQVILIGDAAPNTRSQVTAGREKYGEPYWKKSDFAESTYWETEVTRLAAKKIPVHTFHVAESAGASFKEIATRGGGEHSFLDVNANGKGAEHLTNVVCERILDGCDANGGVLVAAYRAAYPKGYL